MSGRGVKREGILDGVLVVSLEQAVAAPFASAKLAEAGARVIKIEREAGDFARSYDHVVHGESAYFVWLNRGKESVVLDIKDPSDGNVLRHMIRRADVYIQNLAPGAAERSGFGSAAMRQENPGLITCDITGYGESGPYADMKAYDNLLQGETGLIAVTGHPDLPAKVGVSIADISAGVHAYAAILEALIQRQRTGEGVGLRVSLFDCLADWMTVPYLHQVYGGAAPPRSGLHHASIAPYGPYTAQDGRQVLIAIQNEREWERFCGLVLEQPELATDGAFRTNSLRVQNRERLDEVLESTLGALPLEELLARLRDAAIAFGRLNTVADLASHPQLRLARAETPTGPVEMPAAPVRRAWDSSAAPFMAGAVPGLGQHTAAVRQEFGGGNQ